VDSSEYGLRKHVELYEAADYFGIDSMKEDLTRHIDATLLIQADRICNPRHDVGEAIANIKDHWSDFELGEFFEVASLVYTDSPIFETLRRSIVTFLHQTCIVLGSDVRFTNALKDVPELAVAMVEIVMGTNDEGANSMVCSQYPTVCDRCKSSDDVYPFARSWLSQERRSTKLIVRGLCFWCVKRDEQGVSS